MTIQKIQKVRIGDQVFEQMKQMIAGGDWQPGADAGQNAAFAELDLAFHFQVGEITGNPLIIRTNQILRDTLRTSMAEVIDRMGCENALYFHRAIIDAIAAHDEETASSLMARHIGKNREYFPEDGDK